MFNFKSMIKINIIIITNYIYIFIYILFKHAINNIYF
jgi:hypothetical protein